MLFKVDMTVNIPYGMPANEIEEIKITGKRPIPNSYSETVNGDISGALRACTPMSVSLMSMTQKNCTRY